MSAPQADYQEDSTTAPSQNDYKSRPGQSEIKVVSDEADIEDPIDGNVADSDAQLGEFEHAYFSLSDANLHRTRRQGRY
jgi:hypothetical protein